MGQNPGTPPVIGVIGGSGIYEIDGQGRGWVATYVRSAIRSTTLALGDTLVVSESPCLLAL